MGIKIRNLTPISKYGNLALYHTSPHQTLEATYPGCGHVVFHHQVGSHAGSRPKNKIDFFVFVPTTDQQPASP
jgi:hypothetical protein